MRLRSDDASGLRGGRSVRSKQHANVEQKVAEAIIETLHSTRQNVLIQRFVSESRGRDIRALVVGDPSNPSTDIGPVIDEEAARKIRSYIEIGKGEGRHELTLDVPAGLDAKVGKPFVGPTIFSGVKPTARIAREEIFGPVLSVMTFRTPEEAVQRALNGAVPKKIIVVPGRIVNVVV